MPPGSPAKRVGQPPAVGPEHAPIRGWRAWGDGSAVA
jgi:hypothetical protein